MKVGVVGLGTAGAAVACLLADRGVDVEVLERAEDPRPVGAGLWLQHLGQRVLDRLGVLEALRARSQEVGRIEVRTATGRRLLDLGYNRVPGAVPALGVHRGTLFSLLLDEVRRRQVPVRLGVRVDGVRPTPSGMVVDAADGPVGPYALVVGCDGARSTVRRVMGEGSDLVARDRPYEYGALWAVVDDPDGLAGDGLFQCLRGTREYLGVLPTGVGRASLFWSERCADMPRVVAAGLPAWRRRADPLAGRAAPLLDRVEELLPASYRDVVVRRPHRVADSGAAVLLGDAAHAMSPQLGTGASLALADAWSLDHHLSMTGSLDRALAAHAASRAAHVRWYQWWTRLMMPVFQSRLDALAVPRDALAPVLAALPGVAPQMVTTLVGDRTSPWSSWTPTA